MPYLLNVSLISIQQETITFTMSSYNMIGKANFLRNWKMNVSLVPCSFSLILYLYHLTCGTSDLQSSKLLHSADEVKVCTIIEVLIHL